jgi:hypothetical protein
MIGRTLDVFIYINGYYLCFVDNIRHNGNSLLFHREFLSLHVVEVDEGELTFEWSCGIELISQSIANMTIAD